MIIVLYQQFYNIITYLPSCHKSWRYKRLQRGSCCLWLSKSWRYKRLQRGSCCLRLSKSWRYNRLQRGSCCLRLSHVAHQAQGHILVNSWSRQTIIKFSNLLKSFLSAYVSLAGHMNFVDNLEKIFYESDSSPTRENGCIIGILQGVS